MKTWIVVVAAGSGSRFGGPKQLAGLGGRPVVARSIDTARPLANGIVLVVPEGPVGERLKARYENDPKVITVLGGETRSASVRHALTAIPVDADIIVVHDAARPLAQRSLFERVIATVKTGADGAICGVPIIDTIKKVRRGRVLATVPRSEHMAIQTPQAFRAGVLRRAHRGNHDATDDAGLVEADGGKVVVVAGDPRNRKITEPFDLLIAEALLAEDDL